MLSDSFSEVLIIVGSLLLQIPLPILAAQILWVNLVSDGFPALALTMEPEDPEIMNKRPTKEKSLVDFEGRVLIVIISLITSGSSLGLFYYFWKETGNLDLARTVTFTALGIDTLFYVFSVKSLDRIILKSKPFRNKYLNAAVVLGLFLQLSSIYIPFFNRVLRTVPLGWQEWEILMGVIVIGLLLIETVKWIFITYRKRHRT
ncbi:cation-translocating P-type ATPase [Candidatus Parcubacteria bacterium]|nr:cation-translocating P-type ATPase [Candidatus Parcubacteria bacterium]